MRRAGLIAGGALLLIALAGTGAASGGKGVKKPANGNFEKGDLRKWRVLDRGAGEWTTYRESDRVQSPTGPFEFAVSLAPRPRGGHSSILMTPGDGTNVLYRDILIPRNGRKLVVQLFWNNDGGAWAHTGEFRHDLGTENQWISVDLLKRNTAPDDTRAGRVVRNLFAPVEGASPDEPGATPLSSDGWVKLKAGVRSHRGRIVRLRLAEVNNRGWLVTGIDQLKITRGR